MKKSSIWITTLCLMVAFSIQAQTKKVAVVTFFANKVIDCQDILANRAVENLTKDILRLRDNPDFNLTPIFEKYHDTFFNDYAKAFPFTLVPEGEVTSNAKYHEFVPDYGKTSYDAQNFLVYHGYKYIYDGFMGKRNEVEMAKLFSDIADGVLFVSIDFAFERGIGFGGTSTLKVRAFTRISLYNKNGEKVFAIKESERCSNTMMMVGGIPVLDPKDILPSCDSAMNELMGDLRKRLDKIAKKAADKL